MPDVDEVIVHDLPWVKTNNNISATHCEELIKHLHSVEFDAAVIFTVYSQSALPSALLAYLAGIPKRLAYCRENPYELLTHWVPDKEPYTFIRHQVERDIMLVQSVGAVVQSDRLELSYSAAALHHMKKKLSDNNIVPDEPWILVHPGVTDPKREYPVPLWIEATRMLHAHFRMPVLVSGNNGDHAKEITLAAGTGVHSVAGFFNMEEFVALVSKSKVIVTVNTVTSHIAAAFHKPVVVLYAMTNPQHTPWKTPSEVLYYKVPKGLESKNEVIRYVNDHLVIHPPSAPVPADIIEAAEKLMGVQAGTYGLH
jgi:ADP-heptose:LPS heptosyltransferase